MHRDIDFVQSLLGIFYANWFLSVLFVFSILAYIIYRYAPKYSNLSWVFTIIIFYMLPSFWYLGNCKWLLPFFVIAIQFSSYNWTDVKLSIVLPSIFVFAVCYVMFQDDYSHSLMNVKNYEYTLSYNLNIVIRSLAGVTGSIIVIYLSKLLYNWGWLNKYVEKIGVMSLPIYVVHTHICDINLITGLKFEKIYSILIVFCLLVLFSIIIYRFCSYCKFFKLLFFGEKI